MRKLKLTLDELKVTSFATQLGHQLPGTIKGGGSNCNGCNGSNGNGNGCATNDCEPEGLPPGTIDTCNQTDPVNCG